MSVNSPRLPQTRGAAPTQKNDINRWDKARKVVEGEGVRMSKFLPSAACIWTVAGSDCTYLVDMGSPNQVRPYCSCDDFHYRVLSGRLRECYHLLAARRAIDEAMYLVFEFKDSDYPEFMRTLLSNIFAHIS
jgi:predicted nucleic acid-binding Zn finger protein